MATAKKNVVAVPDPPYTVTLELTQEEAQHLQWVLGRLYYKGETSVIYDVLYAEGVAEKRPSSNPFITVDKAPFSD
jgi:hypothetical protein